MDAAAEVVSVAVLVLLVAVVVRRAVVANIQTARRSSMTSTSADRRPTSGRLLLMASVGLGLFALALALYLLIAAWPAADASSTYAARLVTAWAQVATLVLAAVCWAASRLAGRREKRAERQWMAALRDTH